MYPVGRAELTSGEMYEEANRGVASGAGETLHAIMTSLMEAARGGL